MDVQRYIETYKHTHTYIHASMHTHTYIHTYTYTIAPRALRPVRHTIQWAYIDSYIHTSKQPDEHARTFVHTCAHMHTYTPMYTYTHLYMHARIS